MRSMCGAGAGCSAINYQSLLGLGFRIQGFRIREQGLVLKVWDLGSVLRASGPGFRVEASEFRLYCIKSRFYSLGFRV